MNKPNKARYYVGSISDGIIPGHDVTGRDDVNAKVTRGEAILPVKTVDALGGPAVVKHLITATNGKQPETMPKHGGKYSQGLMGSMMNGKNSVGDQLQIMKSNTRKQFGSLPATNRLATYGLPEYANGMVPEEEEKPRNLGSLYREQNAGQPIADFVGKAFPNTAAAIKQANANISEAQQVGGAPGGIAAGVRNSTAPLRGIGHDVMNSVSAGGVYLKKAIVPYIQVLKGVATGDYSPIKDAGPTVSNGAGIAVNNRNIPSNVSAEKIGQKPVVQPNADTQNIKSRPALPGGIAAQPKIAKPATKPATKHATKPAANPTIDQPIDYSDQPQADYYDGRQAYIDRVGATDAGLQELQRTNRDANEIAVYKSNLAKAGYEGSDEHKKMIALGDQKGAANNPNDQSTWGPTDIVRGMKPITRISYDKNKPQRGWVNQEAYDEIDTANQVGRKAIGDPISYAESSYLTPEQMRLSQEGMQQSGALKREGMQQSGANARHDYSANELNKIKLSIANGLASDDPIQQAAAIEKQKRMNAGTQDKSNYIVVGGGEDEMGVKQPQRLFDTTSKQFVDSSSQPKGYVEGKTYTDANGNKAMYKNGSWIGVK